jgi:hypothetical protein
MFTSEQYRAKAIEYDNLVRSSANANEKHEYQKLQQRFAELADNEEWLVGHDKQILHVADTKYSGDAFLTPEELILRNEHSDAVPFAQEEEEHILRCLGAALIMQWGTLPRKLQRELFDNAGATADLLDAASLRGRIARFLHKNNSELH